MTKLSYKLDDKHESYNLDDEYDFIIYDNRT